MNMADESGAHPGMEVFVSIQQLLLWNYSGENNYLIPCSICKFVQFQRNEQSLIFIVVLF